MDYICRLRLSLNGKEFLPGQVIPEGLVLGSRVRALKTSGYIADIDSDAEKSGGTDGTHTVDAVKIMIGTKEYDVSAAQLQDYANVMMKNAKDAAAAIEDEVDMIVLEMLANLDGRKTVKEAAEKQLTIISSLNA